MSAADDDPEPSGSAVAANNGERSSSGRSEWSSGVEAADALEGKSPLLEEQTVEPTVDPKAARKAARKAAKADRRAVREGRAAPGVGRKACELCGRRVDLLVRCQVDASKRWQMACGRCWQTDAVAGGVADGSGTNPHYRYGGLWKNLKKGAAQ